MHVVWFKRDLRTIDHAPLADAAALGPVCALYVIEPEYWSLPDTSARQWAFTRECLLETSDALAALGLSLVVRIGSVNDALSFLHAQRPITALHSHQETGNLWTFERDKAVAAWCRTNGAEWHETPQFGVIRGLKDRDGWARHWENMMRAPLIETPTQIISAGSFESHPISTSQELHLTDDSCPDRQVGGRTPGLDALKSFLNQRGAAYHKEISSPLTAFDSGSRISPYLAMGCLSMREVHQATEERRAAIFALPRPNRGTWGMALKAFSARIHWHCHFIQKLENAPRFEISNVHPGYDGMRDETDIDAARLNAWKTGHTGFPFIDACMRALIASGWINFRMRAMLMAFASYHLWLHWRPTGLHLARMFTDYEPGIHWNQVQMQSGTTGINTVRMYNPVKQSQDQDPDGVFIRRWIPELAHVPDAFIHEPWKMTPLEEQDAECRIGIDYPAPIIDHMAAARAAREMVYSRRKSPGFREEADRIQARHGSRKSGLPPAHSPRRRRTARNANLAQTTMDV